MAPAGLMFEEPLKNLGCAVIPAGPGNTSSQLDIMLGPFEESVRILAYFIIWLKGGKQ